MSCGRNKMLPWGLLKFEALLIHSTFSSGSILLK